MLASAAGDLTAQQKLRNEILNMPAWEEAILFACERLSRDGRSNQAAAAKAIIQSLGVDPMLAAEMIFRSADEVWSLVKNDVLAFVGRWHIQGRVDRALRFMVTTGQAEFASEIWLLITAQDNQTQLRALRVARRFRPGVLGPDATARLAALPTEQREVVASELIHHGDANAIEMVATYALTESDPEVLSEIIQALTFRQSGRWVQKLLEKAPEQVWTDLAKRGYGRELAGTAAGPRLQAELIKLTQQITNPNELLSNLLNGEVGSAFETEISKAIANPEFKADDRNAAYLLQELHKKVPQAVTSALVTRLRAGLAIPYGSESLLDNAPLSDDDNLTQALLKAGRPKGDEISLARLASAVVIKALLNELALRRQALNRLSSEQQRNEFYGLKDVIQATKPEPFAEALVTVGDTDEIKKIGLFAEVLAGHSHDHSGDPPKEIKSNTLTETVRAWAQKTLTDAMSGRERRSEVARAIGRLADPSLLGELVLLLDADIAGIATDRENALAARAKGQAIGALTLYDTQYGQAFLAIGGAEVIKAMQDRLTAPDFGLRAAIVLRQIWEKEQQSAKPRRFGARWPDYSEVSANRKIRKSSAIKTHPLAASILEAASNLSQRSEVTAQKLGLALARVGFTMTYNGENALIAKIFAMPLPLIEKRQVFLALTAAGEILDADLMLQGLKEFLEKAKTQTWLLDENHPDLGEWLELVAFSNRPSAIKEALAMLPPQARQPWRLRPLISSLQYLPDNPEEILNAIATDYPEFKDTREWQEALLSFGLKSSTFDLLEALATTKGRSKLDEWHTAQQIAERVRTDPLLRQDAIKRFSGEANSLQPLMRRVLVEIADEEIVMVLVRHYITACRQFDGELRRAIENAATRHRPSQEWKGAYEVLSAPVPDLRKHLFEMINAGGFQAELAGDCLTCIDRLRDEHGRADTEPRHPDVTSNKPWPREAASPDSKSSPPSSQEEYE